jgi:hypothetical protein
MSDAFDPFASGQATEAPAATGDTFDPFASGQATEVAAPTRDWRKKESLSDIFARSKATVKAGSEQRKKERKQAYESVKAGLRQMGDLMAIDEEEGRRMAENEAVRASSTPGGLAGIGRYSGFGQAGEYFSNKPQRLDIAMEAGIPLAAQILTTEFSPAVQSWVGAGASVLGNALAQGRRMLDDEQEGFQFGQSAQAFALGKVLVAGPLKAGATAARPFVSMVGTTAKTAAKMGAAGALGETLRTGIDEGRLPSTEELTFASSIPAAFTISTLPVQLTGAALAKGATTLAKRAETFRKAGIRPTPAMLYPEKFAPLEREMAQRGAGDVSKRIGGAYDDLGAYTESLYPNVEGKAELFNDLAPLLNRTDTVQKQVAKLDDAARQAFAAKEEALTRLKKVVATGESAGMSAAYDDALKARDGAFQTAWSSTLKNAQDLQVLKQTEGYARWTPARQRDEAVEHFIKPAIAALDDHFDTGYRLIETATPVKGFNTASIVKEADDVLSKLTAVKETAEGEALKSVGRKSDSAMSLVKSAFGEGKEVSLQDLRNVRDDLSRRVRMGAIDSSAEEHAIKGVISRITDTISGQAKEVYGEELGQQLVDLNSFYRRKATALDKKGVSLLYAKEPTDASITTIVKGMLDGNGVDSDEYKNLLGVASLVEEINPMAGAAVRSHFRSAIREGVIGTAATHYDASLGKTFVDGEKLTEALGKLERQPGTLEALGLGNRDSLARLQALFQKFPEASQMTQEQITQLVESPAFRDGKASFYTTMEKVFAENQAENQIKRAAYLRKSGDEEAALEAYTKAKETLYGVTANADAAKKRLAELMDDPKIVALSQFKDTDLDGFLNTFRTATSKERQAAAAALPEGLKDRLEQRALADFFGSLDRKVPMGLSEATLGVDPTKISKLLTSGGSEAKDTFRYFQDFISPERLAKLQEIADASTALMEYERLGQRRVSEITGKSGAGGSLVGGARRIAEMANYWVQRGQYKLAADVALGSDAAVQAFSSIAPLAEDLTQTAKVVSEQLARPVRLLGASVRAAGERERGLEPTPEESPVQRLLTPSEESPPVPAPTPEQEAQYESLLQQLRASRSTE